MTVIEIFLIIIGMVFVIGSFWVTEKLSPEELNHISELSKEEMGIILEHELNNSKQRVESMVDETIDASKERTERVLDKQTNEKIIAINEYSDTVIEKMNKTHNEIMFLYSMLNDKHNELTDFSSEITRQVQKMREQEEEITQSYLGQLKKQLEAEVMSTRLNAASHVPSLQPVAAVEEKKTSDTTEQEKTQTEQENEKEEDAGIREKVFALYREGRDSVHIAKKLGMGVGEVRLILGLYKGDYSGEV